MIAYFALFAMFSVAAAFAPLRSNGFVTKLAAEKVKMPPPPSTPKSGKPVAETVAGSPDHKLLAAALKANGLDTVLNGAGSFVIFAPTDAAFKKLPAGATATADILKYHVSTNTQLPSRNGRSYYTLNVDKDGDAKEIGIRITVGEPPMAYVLGGQKEMAKIAGSIQASNGYVHVIEEVLLPYEGKFPPYMNIKEPIPEGYTTPKVG